VVAPQKLDLVVSFDFGFLPTAGEVSTLFLTDFGDGCPVTAAALFNEGEVTW
jgi:hypothetical protein